MRILYVITKANWGGAQRYVYDLAHAARSAGHEVALAYGTEGELAERLQKEGFRTMRIGSLTRDVGFFREISSFFELLALLRKERPDLMHVNSSKAGALGCLAGRLAGVRRIIFTAHGWAFNERRPFWQKLLIYKIAWLTILLSSATICVSGAVKNDTRWMPFVRRKCFVIHNGVSCSDLLERDAARAKLAPPAIGRYWIGMLSELHPTKRVQDAVRAFAQIAERHPDASLIVIGEGEERKKLELLIRDLGMSRRIMLAGHVPDARKYLRAFDLFVHASNSEGLGLAILEAGCAGLPVIATRVGGIPEIIADRTHGRLVPPRDPVALAGAMEELMQAPQEAHELGARLHARVLAEFSTERMARDTLALYAR